MKQNIADHKPASEGGKSLFRRRSRKAVLGAAALILGLSLLVGLWLKPEGRMSNFVRIQLQHITTNESNEAIAWFSVTNAGKTRVTYLQLVSVIKSNATWAPLHSAITIYGPLSPGETTNLSVRVPQGERVWKGMILWLSDATQSEMSRFLLREKVGSMISGLKPDRVIWMNEHYRVNYSEEFPR